MASTAADAAHDIDNVANTLAVVSHDVPNTMNTPCKGKTARSWLKLPEEVVRLIATHYLLDLADTGFCPQTWDAPQMWPQRIAYTTLRDAREMERIMELFPGWKPHLEHHLLWNKACSILDPMGAFNHLLIVQPSPTTAGSNKAEPVKVSMYAHFRTLMNGSCAVCRVNYPYNAEGLGAGSYKRSSFSPYLGTVMLCKEHRKTAAFCGVCLREAPRAELEDEFTQGIPVCCVENEDRRTWPDVEATCRSCRAQAFWARVNIRPQWREAVNGTRWSSLDWEIRHSVESFIDLGEGNIPDVLVLAEEKHWLRTYTKLGDMLQQAVAASRFAARAESGYNSDEELSEDEVEDPDFLSITEDSGGIRELALNDWARNRILDGHWISPADEWFGNYANGRPRLAPALHPCPWNRRAVYEGALEEGQGDEAQELEHPRPKTHLLPHPPTQHLCELTFRAFSRQMREILLPPMRNIVRKIVMECAADGTDPAVRANKMTMEDVMRELRDESTWYNGIDWLERRVNARLEERRRAKEKEKDEDDSSSSSHSGGSHTTSPVLSTTTLHTTPSPPPSGKEEEVVVSSPMATAPPVPMSPILKSPELLRPIPYVPVTVDHMPFYSGEAFSFVWREACAPLYQCQCSICERAMLNANMAPGSAVISQAQLHPSAAVAATQQQTSPVQIKIQEAPLEALLAQAREDEDLDVSEDESLDEDGESERADGDDTTSLLSLSVPESDTPAAETTAAPQVTPTARKRPSTELESDALEGVTFPASADGSSERGGTPPKRARRVGSFEGLPSSPSPATHSIPSPIGKGVPASPSTSPGRQRKRSSEELELELVDREAPGSGKRMRPEGNAEPLDYVASLPGVPTPLPVLAPLRDMSFSSADRHAKRKKEKVEEQALPPMWH
ncbi:hypothetical protein C8Q77DRAFT_1281263 [Trametes polyzona]|nr:hypothetical protein C8Q77DRAFT_1281263 [Trametes polyzona]